jgi:hypothetical protein
MKKIMLVTCLLAFAFTGLFAQAAAATQGTKIEGYSAQSPAERAKTETDNLNATVQLTAEQYSKVLEVNKQFFTQTQSGNSSTPAALQANDREAKIKAILTATQYKKLQAAKAK